MEGLNFCFKSEKKNVVKFVSNAVINNRYIHIFCFVSFLFVCNFYVVFLHFGNSFCSMFVLFGFRFSHTALAQPGSHNEGLGVGIRAVLL